MNELILAVVDFLRSKDGLSLSASECDEQPDGQPPPNAGQVYYAVHEGGWRNNQDEHIDEMCAVNVTITLRAGFAPQDRTGLALLRDIRNRRASLRAKIHNSYKILELANDKLTANYGANNGFIEPLRFRDAGKPEPKGPEWFFAEHKATPTTGYAVTLRFENARRVQTNESMV